MPRRITFLLFAGLSLVAFVATDLGFDALARIRISGEQLPHAIVEPAYYMAVQPIGTLFMFSPFLVLAWICASLARASLRRGSWLLIAGFAVLAYMFYVGHINAQMALTQHKWTAAALSVGLIPFKSVLVLGVCLVLRFVLVPHNEPAKT